MGLTLETILFFLFAMIPVYFTNQFIIHGTSFFEEDTNMSDTMLVTVWVILPSIVILFTVVSMLTELVWLARARGIRPSQNPFLFTSHARGVLLYGLIAAAWCFFSIQTLYGTIAAWPAAAGAFALGAIAYFSQNRSVVSLSPWRILRRGAAPLTPDQQAAISQQAILDEYASRRSPKPADDSDSESLVPPYTKTLEGNILFPGKDDAE